MGQLFSYALASSLVMLTLYPVYRLLMSADNQPRFNRFTLLSIYAITLLLPVAWLLDIIAPHTTAPVTTHIEINGIDVAALAADDHSVSVGGILLIIYAAGVAATSIRTLVTVAHITRIIAKGRHWPSGNYILVTTLCRHIAPFSWYRYAVITESDRTSDDIAMILTHESAHIERRHYLDLIISQAVCIIQWFNPAAWLMQSEIKTVHEYEADRAVLQAGFSEKDYQMLLIKKTVGQRFPSLANSLNHSKLKKRITMMYSKQSSPTRRLRVMAIVPATVVGMMLLNVPQVNGAISSMASARFNPMAESDAKVTTIMPKRQTKQPSAVTSTVTPRITQQFVANQEKSSDRATTSAANGTTDNKPQATQAEKPTDKGDRTVLAPECLPKFKGGEAEMFRFIHSAIQYPQNALDAQLQGMVVVQFDITPDGDVTDATVVKSVAPILDAEAIRVIESTSGHWTPGTMNGERVTCRFTMPVSFKLQADPNPSK